MKVPHVTTTIKLPLPLHDALREVAERDGRSLHMTMLYLLRRGVVDAQPQPSVSLSVSAAGSPAAP